jgi:hypothetical protein
MEEGCNDNAAICVEQSCNRVDAVVLIGEKIADSDCSFLGYRKVDSVRLDDVSPLSQTESLRRVEIGLEHLREIGTQSMHPLAKLSVP